MARSFVINEAVAVSNQHKEIIRRLNCVNEKQKKWESFAALTAKELVRNKVFSEYADTDLSKRQDNYAENQDIVGLLCELYSCIHLPSLMDQAARLAQSFAPDLQQRLESLKPALSSVRWFFTSSKKKDEAEEAFTLLAGLLEGSYPERAEAILSQSDDVTNPDPSDVIQDFAKNREPYYLELRKIAPDLAWDEFPSGNLAELISSLSPSLSKLDQCEQAIDRSKHQVEKRVKELAAKQAMKSIQEIPVEELRSSKDNLRIKALRDDGFETLADVYSASVYQISSIRGISMDSAYTIKRRAKEMVEEAQRTARIKLSADNRSEEATNVIAAIYAYQNRKPYISKYEKLKSQGIYILSDDLQQLINIGNGARLLFSDYDERQHYYDSFQRATWLRDNGFVSYIDEIAVNLEKHLSFSAKEAWQSFTDNPTDFFTVIEEIVPGVLGNSDTLYGLPEDLAQEIQDEAFFPDGLLCTLRRYQEWGVKYILHQEKVLLGDEMGLGKTIQAIATMVSLKNIGEKHFLVVCPASVITNWFREIRKNSKLRATIIHGAGKKAALKDWIRTGGVAVTSYESTGIIDLEASFRLGLLVVDEAHYIKNATARRSENVRNLCKKTERILFMTGTALENKVEEMISLIGALRPDIAQQVSPMAFMLRAPQFREAIAPVYYRRKREDVLTELPDLIEKEEWCSLLHQEEYIYEQAVLDKHYAEARRVSWNVDDPAFSSKALRLKELVEEAASDGRKVLVFSFFLDTIDMVMRTLGDRCMNPINGSVSPQRRQQIIDEFEKAPAGAVLPAQIVSGGTGLNIQSASVVIICEPQLKPSIENQAIARAYRMGQARNVFVFRLLAEGTIDERITEMLRQKQELFDAFADKSVAAQQSLDLDEKTFGALIQDEIDRINNKRGSSAQAK